MLSFVQQERGSPAFSQVCSRKVFASQPVLGCHLGEQKTACAKAPGDKAVTPDLHMGRAVLRGTFEG